MYKILKLCVLFLMANSAMGQTTFTGKIVDAKTKEPLAFANITFNNNPRQAVTSDIDGKFSYSAPSEITVLTCSYVGYDNQTIKITKGMEHIDIALQSSMNGLEEVLIRPGENPANRIIRNAIANKEKNNPENIPSFKYTSYNKIVYSIKPEGNSKKDSISRKAKEAMKGSNLFLMESVSERKFIAPDISEETVTATRVSGFKNPTFASLATDLQPFSFYKDNIRLFDIQYLNPISKGSLKKYSFHIEDTIFQGRDTVYVISFRPQKNKNFESLRGTLHINTHNYAVQNVIAQPFEKGLIDIRIQQQYAFVNNKYWFPQQLNYVLTLSEYNIVADGKSYISDVETDVPLRKKDFAIESVRMDRLAAKRDSIFWDNSRVEALTAADKRTYTMLDSLGTKHHFDSMLAVMTKITDGKIPAGIFDIDFARTFVYNKYEGFRPGLGLYTNEKLFDHLVLGGFFGYGMKDYEWKYGGEFKYTLSERNEFMIGGKYQDNLIETGGYGLNYAVGNLFNARNFIASRMDRVREESWYGGSRMLRYIKWKMTFTHSRITPLYDYQLMDNGQAFAGYTNTNIRLDLRFAYKERIISSLNRRIPVGTQYPVLNLSYAHGLKGVFNGDFNYSRIEARLEQSFFSRNFGTTKYRLEGGYIDKPLPYGQLFTGEGSYDKEYPVIMSNYFQTMMPYEFLSDRYANLFLSHNFGTLLLQLGDFKPAISLHGNFGWGDLSDRNAHQFIDFSTKRKIFSEAGLQVDNVIKLNYMNVGYLGFGSAVYYRYGAYSNPDFSDNIVYKFTVSYSIK